MTMDKYKAFLNMSKKADFEKAKKEIIKKDISQMELKEKITLKDKKEISPAAGK